MGVIYAEFFNLGVAHWHRWMKYDHTVLSVTCIFMPLPLGVKDIVFWVVPPSVCPSVCPSESRNTLFKSLHGSVGPSDQPWPFLRLPIRPSARTSARPSGQVSGHSLRTHGVDGLKYCMLMYPDHLKNWLAYGHGLFIFILFASL